MISYVTSKSKQKIAVLRVQEDSDWISCRSITDNLEKAYQNAHLCESFYLYSKDPTLSVIDRIIDSKARVLAFIDHRIRLLEVLKSKKFIKYLKENNVKVIIHVFGCFYDRLTEYFEAGEILKNLEVVFVAASPRHRDLVRKIVPYESVNLTPFPVDTAYFKYDQNKRKQFRDSLHLNEQNFLFVYSGRISSQKNVEVAMKLLAERRKDFERIKFLYIGNFDHYEPFLGQSFLGQMEQINSTVLKRIDPNNEWCSHLPQVSHDDLIGYLCAADAYISLSTYRSDDFAMSVAEAKVLGLPAFLTDWAGHSGYKDLPNTYFAKVEMLNDDLAIHLSDFISTLDFDSTREETASLSSQRFSLAVISSEIDRLIKNTYPPFAGLNSKKVFLRKQIRTTGLDLMNKAKEIYETYYR